ncbi:hypothetical protein DPMN_121599 [Dreissena polymorpha]|uniref:Uncharacterized protein n=1 Tax=Dreissena polymorpha TaxID=45954 RepID=A0A9D4GTW0_DREPO|nr:hypothetical protein DPMN_121599 [Dreissena polymorpha]
MSKLWRIFGTFKYTLNFDFTRVHQTKDVQDNFAHVRYCCDVRRHAGGSLDGPGVLPLSLQHVQCRKAGDERARRGATSVVLPTVEPSVVTYSASSIRLQTTICNAPQIFLTL